MSSERAATSLLGGWHDRFLPWSPGTCVVRGTPCATRCLSPYTAASLHHTMAQPSSPCIISSRNERIRGSHRTSCYAPATERSMSSLLLTVG